MYAFSKLTKLSFEKGKLHNASLIAGIRAILTILKYNVDPEIDITTATY